jgi:HEAT repeat protein
MDASGQASGWGERTGGDLSSLLVELGRVTKATRFYGREAPATAAVVERTWRAWRSELARAGPLELEVIEGGFRLAGVRGLFGSPHLTETATALCGSGVQRIRFTEVLSAASLALFVDSLLDLENGQRPVSQLGIEIDGEICVSLDAESGGESLPRPSVASLGASLLGGRIVPVEPGTSGVAVAVGMNEAEEDVDPEKPRLDASPLGAPPGNPDAARLVANLNALDRCSDDERYARIAERVADGARSLCDDGSIEEGARAMIVLADHVMGEGGRSAVQARIARQTLLELALGERLGELIDRACGSDTVPAVRAAQVLLMVGEQAVPSLLERLGAEGDGPRAGQLMGVLIALGESTASALTAAMASGSGARARLAVRMAGDVRAPQLIKPLRDLLCAREGPLQRDAARALVETGNGAAQRALLEALESKHDRTAEIAAGALGTLAAPRTLGPLVRRLERATQERRWNVAREILRAIGHFPEADRSTARALLAWVQRGGPPWRRPNIDLKLEAVAALGHLPGQEVGSALREIARHGFHARLAERARRILERRADGGRSEP